MDDLISLKRKMELNLKNSCNDLERQYFKNAIEEILNDISMIEVIIKDEFALAMDTKKLITQYTEVKDQLYEIKCLWPCIKEAEEISSNLIELDIEEKNHTLSKEDLVELTYDFFKNALDRRLYGNFMKNFYRKNDHLRFLRNDFVSGIGGTTYPLSFLGENYITIKRSYTITDLLTLIHEYMHATTVTLNPNHSIENKTQFGEIDAIFSEMLAYDYFKKYLPEYKLDLGKYYAYLDFNEYATIVSKVISLIEYEKNNYEIKNNKILKTFSREIGIPDYEINDIFMDAQNSDLYALGYIYALEFYKMYETDKDKALCILEKFIMYDGKSPKDYYKFLNGYNIIPNEHMREYHKDINRCARVLSQRKNG